MSRSGKASEGLQVKVTFNKPAEGGKECIARFDGVVADGTYPSTTTASSFGIFEFWKNIRFLCTS